MNRITKLRGELKLKRHTKTLNETYVEEHIQIQAITWPFQAIPFSQCKTHCSNNCFAKTKNLTKTIQVLHKFTNPT